MSMKAVVYKGPFEVAVEEVPLPTIQHPADVIVRITSSAICGSDLHMYEDRTAAKAGLRFGHENMGIVEELGSGVTVLKKGDRVVMPFNVACGSCLNCQTNKTAFCTNVNEGFAGGAYGYVAMGPYHGGQAERIRVPFADFNALVLPPGSEHEADFMMLADVFPTGYHGCILSGLKPGESIAVWGAGPVGLMAAYSARLMGAADIYVIDRVPERLALCKKFDGIPIDFSKGDAVDAILKMRGGKEVDRCVDAVGYQAVTQDGKTEQVNIVLNQMVRAVRACGGLGIPGLYVPTDPGASDEHAKLGQLMFPFGKFFEKGLSMGTGQANVKTYNRQLRDLIVAGIAKPSFIVSNEVGLSAAPDAYVKFQKRVEGYSKVILKP
ncbi:GroES-like protein [Microstroma glucosiphilum]|uniref:GroES-like protein n=1 Tax=Pseudomicrostroma glucosiphilum TaxID=1684307 RepID=A0A316U1R5_9BASI|nr:GroES-like protein [Pseudomicrostroma glucosiphilum]PWN19316.1 GroES-like protein [Pseudomicrostroma glucosiphilum]